MNKSPDNNIKKLLALAITFALVAYVVISVVIYSNRLSETQNSNTASPKIAQHVKGDPSIEYFLNIEEKKAHIYFKLGEKTVWEPEIDFNGKEMFSNLVHQSQSSLSLQRNIGITANYIDVTIPGGDQVELLAYDFDQNKQLTVEKKLADKLNKLINSIEYETTVDMIELTHGTNSDRWFVLPGSIFATIRRNSFPLYEIGIRENEIYLVKEYAFKNGCGVKLVEKTNLSIKIHEEVFEICKNYKPAKVIDPYITRQQFEAEADVILITPEGEIKDL